MSYMSEAEVNARAASEGPAEPTPSVFIMGAGVVGTALAARLVRAGIPVTGLHGRQVELTDAARAISGVVGSTGDVPQILSESDVIIISVRDDRVSEVAERLASEGRLRREQILLHTSGANPARLILAAALPHVRAVGTLHPLVSFADARVAVEGLQQVAFGIEGDEPARAIAKRIVRALGARAVFLEAENLALYHAGAVMASNYVVALADTAQSLLIKAGVPADQALPILIPLLQSVVQNLAQLGLPGALTGRSRGATWSRSNGTSARSRRARPSWSLFTVWLGETSCGWPAKRPTSIRTGRPAWRRCFRAQPQRRRPRADPPALRPVPTAAGVPAHEIAPSLGDELAFWPALRLSSGPVLMLRPWRGSSVMHKRFALRFGTALALSILVFASPSAAGKPEDVFKGKIVITKNRLPMRFASPGAFVGALQKNKIDKIWPTEESGAEHGTWNLEYLAFFAQPLDDSEIQVKFYDITGGDKRYVAGDPQYTRERGSRIFGY